MSSNSYHTLGKFFIRKDGRAKVEGKEKYVSDLVLPGMLFGKVLRSPFPHARVKWIDVSRAEDIGAVCLTPEEVPKVRYNERSGCIPEVCYKDRTVLTDTPRHVGEAVAAVAAENESLAHKALDLIEVEYERLPAVFDPAEAMKPGSVSLWDTIQLGDKEISIENNVAVERVIEDGDIDSGFGEADITVEREFKTGRVYHCQMETKSVVCHPETDGGITLWPTTQTIHNTRILLGEIFGIPLSRISVKRVPSGGHFGSGAHMNSIIPICAGLALKAGYPVKMVPTREEDMYDHCKYPSIIRLKLGAKSDGTLTSGHMKVIVDIGAHNTRAYSLIGVMAGWLVSLYRLSGVKVEGRAIYTNKVPASAMQGFGNPQVTFAVESLIDEIAEKLGFDPIEFRLKNFVGLGDTFWGQGPTVKSVIKSCGVEEELNRGAEMIGWHRRSKPGEQRGIIRRGIGVGRGFHTSGAGAPQPGEVIDYSGAFIKMNEDGSVDVITALMDHGGGTLDAVAKIVAEELGVPLSKVNISPVDTRTTVYDVCTHATRGIYFGGGAAHKVAKQVKTKLLKFASEMLEASPDDLVIRPDDEREDGIIFVTGSPKRFITVSEVAKTAHYKSWGTFASVDSLRQENCPPVFVTYFMEVEVDTETGKIKPVRVVIGCDCGTVINPILASGQLHGGMYRGLGFALLEDTDYNPETGELNCGGFMTDYKLLTPLELPGVDEIKIFFTDTKEPTGPFGAKGIGEAALNPVAGAVGNAVYNATGIRLTELPITPEKVLKALREKE